MVWIDIFMQANQFVLVGFSIAMRVLIGIVFGHSRIDFLARALVRAGAASRGFEFPHSAAGAEGASRFRVKSSWRHAGVNGKIKR